MQNACTNIYFAARRAAGHTREKAAEMIPVSVRSLADYENGRTIPPNEVVERMVICYGTQYLAYQHLHETNTLAARVVPSLERRPMIQTVVRLYNDLKRFDNQHNMDALLEIAEDDRVDAGERAEFDGIVQDLQEILKTSLELAMFLNEGV